MIPRRFKKPYIIFLGVIVLCIYILSGLFSEGQPSTKKFTFNLDNQPYSRLQNGNCTLQKNGRWNCPDIRSRGSNKLRQSQLVLARMLMVFDALAKKYNLRYWITRGTLLGAARHKGFIPWDIDLDVVMPIEDYVKFQREASKELPSDMFLQQHEKEQSLSKTAASAVDQDLHKLSIAVLSPWNPRIRDKKSCYMTCLIKKCKWHDGIMVDLYPIVLKGGSFLDQFAVSTRVWRFFGISHGRWYQVFPLTELEFEGFKIPVPYEWRRELQILYGESYMKLPTKDKQYPPDGTVPEPNIACPRI